MNHCCGINKNYITLVFKVIYLVTCSLLSRICAVNLIMFHGLNSCKDIDLNKYMK